MWKYYIQLFIWSRCKALRVLLFIPLILLGIILHALCDVVEDIGEIPRTFRNIVDDKYREDTINYLKENK